jgi:long-chain acyl-CoA synthetase
MALNVAECVTIPAKENPAADALVIDDVRISFGALLEQVRRVAAFLHRAGVERGDRVGILLPNTPHFPIVYYGILYAGGIAVPMNPLQTAREFQYLFEDFKPRLVFVWTDLAEIVGAAVTNSNPSPEMVVVEPDLSPSVPDQGYSFLTEMARSGALPVMAETKPDDVAVILYTAAYQGKPLGAQLTHFGIFQNAQIVGTRILHFSNADRCLAVLPLFHSFGQCATMNAALLSGASMHLMPRFDGAKVLEAIESERLTFLALVPTMYHFLLGSKPKASPDLSSLRRVVVGGATMPAEIFDAFKARFGYTILEGYGLTETSPVVSFNMTEEANRPGSVGMPLWGCDVRIVDVAGDTLPPGETGEILVRGHNVMKGYLNQPEITAETIQDGWLRTGDWGALDEDGYIYLKGLKKDMLIRAGLNVYPREIELILETHPFIEEAAVIGVPGKMRGEEAKAFVMVKANAEDLDKQLKGYCREQLAGYKCPRFFEVVEAFPRTPAGAVDKDALRAR